MQNRIRCLASLLVIIISAHTALGQDAGQRRKELGVRLAQAKSFFDRMPPLQRKALSAGAQNFRNLAENWAEIGSLLGRTAISPEAVLQDPALADNDAAQSWAGESIARARPRVVRIKCCRRLQ